MEKLHSYYYYIKYILLDNRLLSHADGHTHTDTKLCVILCTHVDWSNRPPKWELQTQLPEYHYHKYQIEESIVPLYGSITVSVQCNCTAFCWTIGPNLCSFVGLPQPTDEYWVEYIFRAEFLKRPQKGKRALVCKIQTWLRILFYIWCGDQIYLG